MKQTPVSFPWAFPSVFWLTRLPTIPHEAPTPDPRLSSPRGERPLLIHLVSSDTQSFC